MAPVLELLTQHRRLPGPSREEAGQDRTGLAHSLEGHQDTRREGLTSPAALVCEELHPGDREGDGNWGGSPVSAFTV